MQVSHLNDQKVYNLSAGKSVPDWLSDRKRRKLQQKDPDIRRRIELIQDFEMPDVSSCICISRDGQFILATGTYKPRVRCFEVANLSVKFERCLDAEVVKMLPLTEGYEKIAFLQEERRLEFHIKRGHHYSTRIPKFGRDMAYHSGTCDLYIVGSGPEVYRLNLEQGRFMTPLATEGSSLTTCDLNPVHQLFMAGTAEGTIEAWDPRTKQRVSTLDVASELPPSDELGFLSTIPHATRLNFKDGLHMAVGTSSGQVILYDIRSSQPLLIKDHMYGLPIKSLAFCQNADEEDLICSLDSRCLKIWSESDGSPFTAIEPGVDLNDLSLVPNSGLLLLANEAPKMLCYFIPGLGQAPKWCSFLDSITEELEEDEKPSVFDDYKFVTLSELQDLGLSNLIGTNLLRAYMHGYFIDVRLYNKAKSLSSATTFKEYKKKKVQQKIDQERPDRVILNKLPKVNPEIAERLMLEKAQISSQDSAVKQKKRSNQKVTADSILDDDRFKSLFENPEFSVDINSEEFMLLNPALAKLEKAKRKRHEKAMGASQEDANEMQQNFDQSEQGVGSDDLGESSSSDEEDRREYVKNMKKVHNDMERLRSRVDKQMERLQLTDKIDTVKQNNNRNQVEIMRPRTVELIEGELNTANAAGTSSSGTSKQLSLSERLALEQDQDEAVIEAEGTEDAVREITFVPNKKSRQFAKERAEQHLRERRKLRRGAQEISKTIKQPPKFWQGKRVA